MAAAIFRLPASTTFTPEQALHDALSFDLTDVIVIGCDKDGDLMIRSSRMTCAEAAFLTEKAKQWAMSGGNA